MTMLSMSLWELVARLRELGVKSVRPLEGVQENMAFPLPKGLALKRPQATGEAAADGDDVAKAPAVDAPAAGHASAAGTSA